MAKQKLNTLSGSDWLKYSFSIWRDIKKGPIDNGVSNPASYPVELPQRLIRILTNPGEQVLDPFMGSGSTVIASLIEGRNSVGIELSEKFFKEAEKRTELLSLERLSNPSLTVKLYNGNSVELDTFVEKGSVNLCVTSPPYWDILNRKRSADRKNITNYSDSSEDLGNITDYEKFLVKLSQVFTKVHSALKDGGYCVVIVMDIRKGGDFFPYHSDISSFMRNIGFKFKDIIIWDRQKEYNSMRPLGYPYSFVVNKVHEYILIFQKNKTEGD
ncbi:MAG: site-specific DNA-methyltransferase [Candidatus Parvarchaeum sp.]|nr:site-specific DNA-methyltransferase [Candidatus Parvarchaeum tengchongense]